MIVRRVLLLAVVLGATFAGDVPAAGAAISGPGPDTGSTLAGPGPATGSKLHPDRILSNEWTFTRWATTADIRAIRTKPSPLAPVITRLHWYTEDGFPEVYLVLRAHRDRQGREWVKIRIPMRPNGRVGWVPREALGAIHLTHELLIVNREQLAIHLFIDGRLRWSAPAGVGKPSTPTPAGHFWIREKFTISDPASGYWPYAFGTSDYSTLTEWPGGGVVGIHGPYYAQNEIPGWISHGCIRLRTWDDAWLGTHVGVGTPVRIV